MIVQRDYIIFCLILLVIVYLANVYLANVYLANVYLSNIYPKKYYLFSYGSNSAEQMKQRLGLLNPPKYYPAFINNYTRIFAGKNKFWQNGATATIYPEKNSKVKGIVFELSKQQIEKIDYYENKDLTMSYNRKIIKGYIVNKSNKAIPFNVYIMNNPKFINLPSKEYLLAVNKLLNNYENKLNNNFFILPLIKSNLPIKVKVLINGKIKKL